jgi:histidinol-phosphate aminotransferase
MAEALRMAGFAVAPSQANFLWVRPPGRTARAWFDALRERRILVRHFPGERTGAYLRVTVGTDAEADTLAAAVRELAT